MQKRRVLVFTAHADDLEVHASALVMRILDDGHEMTSYVTTHGLPGQTINGRDAREVRMEESSAAHAQLGLTPNFEHARFEQELNVDPPTRAEFKKLIMDQKPDVVITHWPLDVNPDHRATAALVIEPCYQLAVNYEILFFEPISSGRWSAETRPQGLHFIPTHYCEVSDALMERKRQLVMCHTSQDPTRMISGQMSLQRIRGEECGLPAAEAWIAGKRCGELLPELRSHLRDTPWKLPRRIGAEFSPETLGITL